MVGQWLTRRVNKCIYPDGTLRGRPEDAQGYAGEDLAKGTYVVTDQKNGAFVKLTWGKTFYTFLRGTGENRPLVVCLAGLGGESSVYYAQNRSKIGEELVKAGYDVLTFDNYGHGFSEGPDIQEYSAELFAGQLAELLVRLDISCKFDLIGHSFGGPIATVFAARFPNRIRRLVLMAPVYGQALPVFLAPIIKLFLTPVVMHFIVEKLKPMGQGANRDNTAWARTFHRAVSSAAQVGQKSGTFAFNDKRFSGAELLASLPDDIQISIIAGDLDTDVSIDEIHALVRELEGKSVTLDVVPGAGHVTYFDGPEAAEHGPIMRNLLMKSLPLP